jgi:hypothetical protein
MKAHKILGALWMTLFAFFGIVLLHALLRIFFDPNFRPSLVLFLSIPVCMFAAVASFFLFRGARWASVVVGIIAILIVITCIWQIRSLSIWSGLLGLFALVSVYFLFLPRHAQAA